MQSLWCSAGIWQLVCNVSASSNASTRATQLSSQGPVVVWNGPIELPLTVVVTLPTLPSAAGPAVLRVNGSLALLAGTSVVLSLDTPLPSNGGAPPTQFVLFDASGGILVDSGALNVTVAGVGAVTSGHQCMRVVAQQQRTAEQMTITLVQQRDRTLSGCHRHRSSRALPWWLYVAIAGGALLCVACVAAIVGGPLATWFACRRRTQRVRGVRCLGSAVTAVCAALIHIMLHCSSSTTGAVAAARGN